MLAEQKRLVEERAILERHSQSTQLLTELSGKVEYATVSAIERESRVARTLDQGLLEREHRCIRLEAELADRELLVTARDKDGSALRSHLTSLTSSMQQELVQGHTDLRQVCNSVFP